MAEAVSCEGEGESRDQNEINEISRDRGAESGIGLDDAEGAGPPLGEIEGPVPGDRPVRMAEGKQESFVRSQEEGQEIRFGGGGMEEGDNGGVPEERPGEEAVAEVDGGGGFGGIRELTQHVPETATEGRFVRHGWRRAG